jgi:hypothetical protein
MSFSELDSPIPRVSLDLDTEYGDIAYSLLTSYVVDLEPRPTTAGMGLWGELRRAAIHETNHPRWSKTIEVGGVEHVVGLYGVYGEMPNGEPYTHSALQCSCGLPDHSSFRNLAEGYQPCPAKNMVIAERTEVYRNVIGPEKIGKLTKKSLPAATRFLLGIAQRPFAWPPSDRSDRLLIEPVAEVFDVPVSRIEELADGTVIQLHNGDYPSISLAA